MAKDKVQILHHRKTNTTWSNCADWDERRNFETIGYGEVEVDISNVFEMKISMEKDGYVLVKENPFKILNNIPK